LSLWRKLSVTGINSYFLNKKEVNDMFEQGLVRAGGIKLFGSTFLGLTLVALSGIVMWQLWRDRQAFQNMRLKNVTRKYEEKLGHVKMRLEVLTAEQSELASQVTQLQDGFYHFQETTGDTPKKAASVGDVQEPDASKLAMLKRIMEDNVRIRQRF
jgi:hypothetical protein